MKGKVLYPVGLVIILLIVIGFVFVRPMYANRKQLLKGERSGTWQATRIEMPGLSTYVYEYFPDGITLTLNANGSCVLMFGDEKIKARWTCKADKISIRGSGIKSDGLVYKDHMHLNDIRKYSIAFFQQK